MWVDHTNGGPKWGQYTAQDVVAEIDATWRTVPGRDHRAIGGLSMGAQGALQLAMRYPDVFGRVQVGTVYRRSFVAYSFMAAYSARLTSVLAM